MKTCLKDYRNLDLTVPNIYLSQLFPTTYSSTFKFLDQIFSFSYYRAHRQIQREKQRIACVLCSCENFLFRIVNMVSHTLTAFTSDSREHIWTNTDKLMKTIHTLGSIFTGLGSTLVVI